MVERRWLECRDGDIWLVTGIRIDTGRRLLTWRWRSVRASNHARASNEE